VERLGSVRGLSISGVGRWWAVALSVALFWLFGFVAQARADVTMDSSADGGPAEGISSPADTTQSTEPTSTDPDATVPPVEPTPVPDPTAPPTDSPPVATDPGATAPPVDPTAVPDPTAPPSDPPPTTTDPGATAPPVDPTPVPDPTAPPSDPLPATEPPPATPPPPVSYDPPGIQVEAPAGTGLAGPLINGGPGGGLPAGSVPPPQGALLRALSRSPDNPRGDDSARGSGRPVVHHPAPVAPDPPRFPAPHTPSAPANSAPGGAGGGFGSSPIGALAALVALLAFAPWLGGVLRESAASQRPADLAFHLTRPG
jgi:hypothetical protein